MMARCTEIRERFDDWLEGRLPAADRTVIEDHLRACDGCRRFFDEQAALAGDLLALGCAADRMAAGRAAVKPVSPRRVDVLQIAAVIVLFIVPGMIIKRVWFDRGDEPAQVVSNRPPPAASGVHDTGDAPTHPAEPAFSVSTDEDRLAVLMSTENPRIHLVWLYDTVRPPEETDHANELPDLDSAG